MMFKFKSLPLFIISALLVSFWFFAKTSAAPQAINIKGLESVKKIDGKTISTNKKGCCKPRTKPRAKAIFKPKPKKKTPIKRKAYKKPKVTVKKYYKSTSDKFDSNAIDCNSVGLNYSFNDCNPIVKEKEIPVTPAQTGKIDCNSTGMNYSYNDCNPQKPETEVMESEPEVVPAAPIEESPPAVIEPQQEELPVSGAWDLALLAGAPGLIVSLKNLKDSKRDLRKSLFKT